MTEQGLNKINVTNFNKALDVHFGKYGKTYNDKAAARVDLVKRGYTLEAGVWVKHGKPAYITRLRDGVLDMAGNIKSFKPCGVLVTYDSRMINSDQCILKEVSKPRQ